MSNQPTLRTERLLLRAHRMQDLDDLAAFHGDPEVVRYVPWPVRDRAATEETLRTKLGQTVLAEHGQWLVLAVELRDTGTVVGEVLLKWASDRQGELGFAFGRDHQGQGYAAEAVAAVCDHLRAGGVPRLRAFVEPGNARSRRLMERLGFTAVDGGAPGGELCYERPAPAAPRRPSGGADAPAEPVVPQSPG